jgi:hypothetical protein
MWKRPSKAGLGPFGPGATLLLVVVALVAVLLYGLVGTGQMLLFTLPAVGLLLLISVEDVHHVSFAQKLKERVMFMLTRRSGGTHYRSGAIGRTPGHKASLPGVAAELQLFEHEDAYGRVFAAIVCPSTRAVSVLLGCDPDGGALVDASQVDSWVAYWGAWLASLRTESDLKGVQVCIETAPDSGGRLVNEVNATTVTSASAFSRQVLDQVKAAYTFGAVSVKGIVTLSFNLKPAYGRVRSIDETLAAVASRLPGWMVSLEDTGAGSVHLLGAQDVKELVRIAYDPAAAALIDKVRATGGVAELEWEDCGPQGADAFWDYYRHDSGLSITWMMSEAPQGAVSANCLQGLLQPSHDITRKRVTLIYRIHDPAEAVRLVDKDVKAAASRRSAARNADLIGRDMDLYAAEAAVSDVNNGAALVTFGLLATATTTESLEKLTDLRAAVENLASSSRVRLRPAFGAQDSAFAACLPLGIWSEDYLAVSTKISDAM